MSQTNSVSFTVEMSENIAVADTPPEYVADKNCTYPFTYRTMAVTASGMSFNMSFCMQGYVSRQVLAKRGLTGQDAFETSFGGITSK